MAMALATLVATLARTAPPPYQKHAEFARWMSHSIDWGVVASSSVHLGGVAFGNPVSFVDQGDGHVYFYVSSMDATMQDVEKDANVSLTLSEAMMQPSKCSSSDGSAPDPEDPTCSRLTFTGAMRRVAADKINEVSAAVFARHPQMKSWPASHDFFFATLDLTAIWLIDFYGGAISIPPEEFYAVPQAVETLALQTGLTSTASSSLVENWRMGPPHGPNMTGYCPVSGGMLNFSATTPALEFKQGQKLYFSSKDALSSFIAQPRDYWLAPHDMPLPGADGMRGLPDVRGEILHCPRSGEAMNVSMGTPRVMMKHGQAVYFCCHGCVTAFWRDPKSYFA